MKKKLSILVAALVATTSIVATSANAAPLAVTVGGVANVTTSAAPVSVAVPSTNVIDAGHSVAIAATADANTVVTFTASGKVKLVSALNTADAPKTSTSGASTASVTSTGVASTVYAYTTSTEAGTVTVVNGSYSTIIYIKGTAGPAAKVIATIPGSVAVNTAPSISVSATDVFGNPVAGESIAVTLVGATFSDNTVTKSLTTASVTSAAGVTPITVLGTATTVLSTVSAGNVTVVATDVAMADTAVGLPAAVKTALITFPVSDLSLQQKLQDVQQTRLQQTRLLQMLRHQRTQQLLLQQQSLQLQILQQQHIRRSTMRLQRSGTRLIQRLRLHLLSN
jgi:hypothetical protein